MTHQAEHPSRAEVERARAALEEAQSLTGIGSWELDLVTGAGAWSKELFRIYGVDPVGGSPDWAFQRSTLMDPRDVERVQAAIDRARVDGAPYTVEYRIRRRDGEVRWVEARGRGVRDASGRLVRLLGTVQDITDRRQIQEERRRSEARLEALHRIAQSPERDPGVLLGLVMDEARALTGSRQALLREYDTETGRFFGGAVSDGSGTCPVPPSEGGGTARGGLWRNAVDADRPLVLNRYADPHPAKGGLPARHLPIERAIVVPVRTAGRTVAVVAVANRPDEYGSEEASQLDCFLDAAWPILERRRVEKALAESERRYRLLADNVHDVIWMCDPDLRFTYVSPSVFGHLGYAPEEVVGLGLDALLTPGSLAHALDLLRQKRETEPADRPGTPATFEAELRRKDGGTIFAEVTARIVTELDGSPVILGVSRDVTERRALRASVAQADRLATMGMLAANVAHEINNPIAFVANNLETLAADFGVQVDRLRRGAALLAPHLDEDGREMVRRFFEERAPGELEDVRDRFRDALDGARRIHEIVGGLRTFARVESEQPAPVALRAPIEAALRLAVHETTPRARVVTELGDDAWVLGHEGKLSQVFLNLVVNAAHALPEGKLDENVITVRTRKVQERIVAEVADTGPGIPPEILGRVFEPFFTTKRVGEGSGLGLNVARNIVVGYGGEIEAHSVPGRGTTIRVSLPAAPPPRSEEGDTAAHPDRDPERSSRVLVIDDEPAMRRVLRRILRDHEVVEAESGRAARAILTEDTDFAVVLCDLMMPDVSGVELHAWLAEARPEVARRVVFVTGGAFTPESRSYLETVENRQVDKPFDPAFLKQLVSEAAVAHRGG